MGGRMAQVRRAMARIPALSELNVHCQPATCLPLAMGCIASYLRTGETRIAKQQCACRWLWADLSL